MDWLKFISEFVDAVAWPTVIIVIVFIFRDSVRELFPNLKRLKYKDFEAEFGKELSALKSITPLEIAAENEGGGELTEQRILLTSLSTFSPNQAVLVAWKEIERSAKELIDRHDIKVEYDVSTPYRLIQRVLKAKGLLDAQKIRVFNELRKLRNKVAHAEDYEITTLQAQDYINLALSIISDMDSL